VRFLRLYQFRQGSILLTLRSQNILLCFRDSIQSNALPRRRTGNASGFLPLPSLHPHIIIRDSLRLVEGFVVNGLPDVIAFDGRITIHFHAKFADPITERQIFPHSVKRCER
jgi:hypothetical protein